MSDKERGSTQRQGSLPALDAGGEADYDPWFDWADPYLPRRPKVTVDELRKALTRLLRPGLPLSQRTAGEVLPNLRSVIARSVHPYDAQSRVQSLNSLLVRLVTDHEHEGERQALAILLAFAKGFRGTTLDRRRRAAADVLGYDHDHFRKRVEPHLLEDLAATLYEDLLRYKRRVRRAPTAEEPTGDTPSLTEEHLTHQEELVSRIWQHVYGLRAELIAQARLTGQPGYESQVEDHRQAAQHELEHVRTLVTEFRTIYGDAFILHGDAEYSSEALERLVTFVL